MNKEPDLTAAQQMAQWITGKWIGHAISAAARLSIADILKNGEATIDELAGKTNTHAPSLYRLMRALAGIGIFRESAPHRFALTPMGELLQAGQMRAGALMAHSDWHDKAWSQLSTSLRTGESGFEAAHGQPLFDWLSRNPEASEIFNEAMTAGKTYRDFGVAEHFDFSSAKRVVDVGGGHGSLMISILEKHPHLHGVIADLPQVAEGAKRAIEKAGLATRCEIFTGSFFDKVPAGGDVYMMAHIIHDWGDADCRKILENCQKAMRGDASILLIESLLAGPNVPDRMKWLDLEMLVLTHGGRERTEDEFRQLLKSAGLDLKRVISTGGSRSIIEGRLP